MIQPDYADKARRMWFAGDFRQEPIAAALTDADRAGYERGVQAAAAAIRALALPAAPPEPTGEGRDAEEVAAYYLTAISDLNTENATLHADLARVKAAMEKCREALEPFAQGNETEFWMKVYAKLASLNWLDVAKKIAVWRDKARSARDEIDALKGTGQ